MNEDIETLLQRALAAGRAGEVEVLGAMVRERDELIGARFGPADPELEGLTLLHALAAASADVVDALLDAGADLDAVTAFGFTPVGCAVYAGDLAAGLHLVERGARPAGDVAVALGRFDLIGDGDDVNWLSAFLSSCKTGCLAGVERALAEGVDVNVLVPGSDWGGIGGTGLHWAAGHGHRALVERLLALGADTSARDDVFDRTPAGWAAHSGHDDIASLLEANS